MKNTQKIAVVMRETAVRSFLFQNISSNQQLKRDLFYFCGHHKWCKIPDEKILPQLLTKIRVNFFLNSNDRFLVIHDGLMITKKKKNKNKVKFLNVDKELACIMTKISFYQ